MKGCLLFLLLLLVSGCVGHKQYTWSSDQGKRCYYTCESDMWQCSAYCKYSYSCKSSCNNAADACMMACPDLTLVQAK